MIAQTTMLATSIISRFTHDDWPKVVAVGE